MPGPHEGFIEYDWQESQYFGLSPSRSLCLAFGVAYVAHRILVALDRPLLSPFEILWNIFVFLMPHGLVTYLAPVVSAAAAESSEGAATSNESQSHAAKSELLRKVFRLDKMALPALGTRSTAPAGLGNWDNSCYQNSVLQALAALENLQHFWEERQNVAGHDLPDTTTAALKDLVLHLNNQENRGKKLWTPPKLKSMSSWQQQDAQEYFSKIMDELDRDTTSALRSSTGGLAELFSSEIEESNGVLQDSSLEMDGASSSTKTTGAINRAEAFRVPQNPLEGLLAQRVGCLNCEHAEGLSLIPFNCITLPLGRSWSHRIEDCLDEYTKLECIDGVECTKCTLLAAQAKLSKFLENNQANNDQDESSSQEQASLQSMLQTRLQTISDALDDQAFDEATVKEKCCLDGIHKSVSTKSRQAIIIKAPRCLVLHINRSLFDEYTGAQMKNYADVRYPLKLDFSPWCTGSNTVTEHDQVDEAEEVWEMHPAKSMIQPSDDPSQRQPLGYMLRAVITHYGRHENGHYVCYKRVPTPAKNGEDDDAATENGNWWRLSDEVVTHVTEEDALEQGGAFMLFYERVGDVVDLAAADDQVTGIEEADVEFDTIPITTELPSTMSPSTDALEAPASPSGSDTTADSSDHSLDDATRNLEREGTFSQKLGKQQDQNRANPIAMRTAGKTLNEDQAFEPLQLVATT